MIEYRGYNITSDGTYLMRKIEAIGRGSVHLSLRGLFTNEKSARKSIDFYEDNKIEKEEAQNDKASLRRRSKQV